MTRFDETMARAKACLSSMIRKRDAVGMAAMRSVMASLENACSVEVPDRTLLSGEIAGAVPIGQSEVPRRSLSDEEVDQILDTEISMRTEQAESFTHVHRDLEAAMSIYQATLIRRLREGIGP